jgi:hypothetical protein
MPGRPVNRVQSDLNAVSGVTVPVAAPVLTVAMAVMVAAAPITGRIGRIGRVLSRIVPNAGSAVIVLSVVIALTAATVRAVVRARTVLVRAVTTATVVRVLIGRLWPHRSRSTGRRGTPPHSS